MHVLGLLWQTATNGELNTADVRVWRLESTIKLRAAAFSLKDPHVLSWFPVPPVIWASLSLRTCLSSLHPTTTWPSGMSKFLSSDKDSHHWIQAHPHPA